MTERSSMMHGVEEFEIMLDKNRKDEWAYHIGGRLPGGPGGWNKLKGVIRALLLKKIETIETLDTFDD